MFDLDVRNDHGITTMRNNASNALCFFLGYRKPGFVVCGVSLSSLQPSRASGSGMWNKDEVSKHSGVTPPSFFFSNTESKCNIPNGTWRHNVFLDENCKKKTPNSS